MLNGFGHGSKPFPENNVGLMPLLYPHFATRLVWSYPSLCASAEARRIWQFAVFLALSWRIPGCVAVLVAPGGSGSCFVTGEEDNMICKMT